MGIEEFIEKLRIAGLYDRFISFYQEEAEADPEGYPETLELNEWIDAFKDWMDAYVDEEVIEEERVEYE